MIAIVNYTVPIRVIAGYATEPVNGVSLLEIDEKFAALNLKGVVVGDVFGANSAYEFFEHGTNADAIRPVTAKAVVWIGTVTPNLWLEGDLYFNATGGAPVIPSMPSGLAARWSAKDLALAEGATVTTWADKVSARAMTTTGGTPSFLLSEKAVRFDGVDDYMDAALSLAQPQTTITIARLPGTLVSVPIVGSSTLIHSISTTSGGLIQINAGASLASSFAMTANAWVMIAAVSNGASSGIMANQGTPTTGNAGSNTRNNVRVAANTGATAFGRVDIKEILVFNRALSQSEISDVRLILNSDHSLAL